MKFEICIDSVQSALNAEMAGADRVELCDNLLEGGTTPSAGMIKQIKKLTNKIKTFIIIRPRGGDFLFSKEEVDVMQDDIQIAIELGVDGIVSGALMPNGEIDHASMKKLIRASNGLPFTFHRAFDMCINPLESMTQLIDLGVDRILTSGRKQSAEQGIDNIAQLCFEAKEQIIIMPGAGINPINIKTIAKKTRAKEFHFSGRKAILSLMQFRNKEINMGGVKNLSEYKHFYSNTELIRETINKLK